jgi:signal transduction histidine kinase
MTFSVKILSPLQATADDLARRQQRYEQHAGPQTRGQVDNLEGGPAALNSGGDVLASARRAGEGDPVDAVVASQHVSDVARVASHEVESTFGELDVGDESIEADPENLQTVLENLFRNAVLHAGPEVSVRVGLLEPGGFFVEDDGPGIPPADRVRVFDIGFSCDEGGTGFGLSIVERVADVHGWTVEVTKGSAGGARFEVRNVEFVDSH